MDLLIGFGIGFGIATLIWWRLAEQYGQDQFNAGRIRGAREYRRAGR